MGHCLSSSASLHPSPPSLLSSSSSSLSSSSSTSSSSSSSALPPTPRKPFDMFSASLLPFPVPSNLGSLFDLGPELGRGQFGIIRRCIERSSGIEFACKSIPKLRLHTQKDLQDVVTEIQVMKALAGHPNIVQLREVVEDRAYVHLIMELCKGGDLFDRLSQKGCFGEAEAAALMKRLMETVSYCHSKGVIHRDLKPENLLLKDSSDISSMKLADFGLAVHFSTDRKKISGMAGSAYYIAPEVLQNGQQYGQEVDVWSAGVILYILLSGAPPFWGETDEGIFEAIKQQKLDIVSEPWRTISASAKDLITKMLSSDVKARLSPSEVLEHPWINYHHATSAMAASKCYPLDKGTLTAAITKGCTGLYSTLVSSVSSPPLAHNDSISTMLLPFAPWDSSVNLHSKASFSCRKQQPCAQPQSFDDFFVSLITLLENRLLSWFPRLIPIRLQEGWGCSCTLLTNTASEQTLLVELGQDRYVIAYDRVRKRVGWKMLDDSWMAKANLTPLPKALRVY